MYFILGVHGKGKYYEVIIGNSGWSTKKRWVLPTWKDIGCFYENLLSGLRKKHSELLEKRTKVCSV